MNQNLKVIELRNCLPKPNVRDCFVDRSEIHFIKSGQRAPPNRKAESRRFYAKKNALILRPLGAAARQKPF